uniref:Uncharacterized protein n=1 Tax=Arundo donax TaxID=35708 RepID=A0A0A9BDU0_ARUDO
MVSGKHFVSRSMDGCWQQRARGVYMQQTHSLEKCLSFQRWTVICSVVYHSHRFLSHQIL